MESIQQDELDFINNPEKYSKREPDPSKRANKTVIEALTVERPKFYTCPRIQWPDLKKHYFTQVSDFIEQEKQKRLEQSRTDPNFDKSKLDEEIKVKLHEPSIIDDRIDRTKKENNITQPDYTNTGFEHQETVILATYPRSGNTLMRAYTEKVSGIYSGSDCDISKKLNLELLTRGLEGEGLVDKRVWYVKTHYPERYGKAKFYADKVVMCLRNPMDSMVSLFNMVATGSHDKSIQSLDFLKYPVIWTEFINQEITVWKDFHEFWFQAKIPIHVIRYEDLLADPKKSLTEMFQFMLNVPNEKMDSWKGTMIEKYIELTVGDKPPEIYKPREGKALANMGKLTQAHLDYCYKHCQDLIDKLGYRDFFNQPKPSDEHQLLLNKYANFIEDYNAKALKKAIYNATESDEITSIYCNYPPLLLRKKSQLYPDGRTSYKFKNFLRNKVTIIDKTIVKPVAPYANKTFSFKKKGSKKDGTTLNTIEEQKEEEPEKIKSQVD